MSENTLDLQLDEPTASPVDEERARVREEFRLRLAEKLKDPEFRNIEGFPIGTDEAILALSDPPYYTACPNPFIGEWLQEHGKPYNPETDDYHREPFAADVSEGKNDPIYNAHSYHTKVPPKAIMRYILHYTEPGDVIYDGFCGTGMTGVAAHMCSNKSQVESLGYFVSMDGCVYESQESYLTDPSSVIAKLGARYSILSDLSPIATFIANNYNMPVNSSVFGQKAVRVLDEIDRVYGWMYSTIYGKSNEEIERITEDMNNCESTDDLHLLLSKIPMGRISCTVWSDVLICPMCGNEIIYWDAAVDKVAGKMNDTFACTSCRSQVKKRECARAMETQYDDAIAQTVKQVKQVPVLIRYSVGKKRHEKRPDSFDLSLISKIRELPIQHWFPSDPMMGIGKKWGDTWRAGYCEGITHVHHFYTRRNLFILATIWAKLPKKLQWLFTTACSRNATRQNRFIVNKYNPNGRINGPFTGTIYFPSEQVEQNIIDLYREKLISVSWDTSDNIVSTNGAQISEISDNSIDYIFTDPPFGSNFIYSELNFLTEAWLRVKTNNRPEAIQNETQMKSLHDYKLLMTACFKDYYRVLKPGRIITVEFHNSANAVWNSIQDALQLAGFIVSDVRTLDKQHGGIKAAYISNTVSQDLVITCYKPRSDFEDRFKKYEGQPEGVIEFIRQHLDMLPVAPITKEAKIEVVAERTRFLLFDRMVAYYLQHGTRIPMSAAEFYKMLTEQFVERDEMYFLPIQAARYDALRARTEVEQLSIFIRDERSAVHWVRTQLQQDSQTLGDLTPKFMQEMRDWDNHEPRPELRDILKENFIQDEDGLWRVPDPNQEKDLEALRHKAYLKTFEGYTKSKGQLKIFRKEAILEGFKHCWQTKQFGVIVAVCESIPAKILQEVPEFVQFYDIAKDLAPTETQQLEFTWEG